MTEVRSRDYEWITVDDPQLFDEGFCLTVFSPATMDEVLAGLPPVRESSAGDLDALTEFARDNGRDLIGGLLQVGESVVLYEPYGYLDDDVRLRLSADRIVVSVDGNVALSHFRYFRDGALKPIRASVRELPPRCRARCGCSADGTGRWVRHRS